jgi:hypothetical protein
VGIWFWKGTDLKERDELGKEASERNGCGDNLATNLREGLRKKKETASRHSPAYRHQSPRRAPVTSAKQTFSHQIKLANTIAAFPVAYVFRAARILQL